MPKGDSRSRRRYTPGPHVVRRPGRGFEAYIPDRKPDPRVSLKTDDERTAHHRFRELLKSGGTPSKDSRPPEDPLSQIADHWLAAPHGWTKRTLQSYEDRATAFVRAMRERGVMYPSQLTLATLDAWREERMKSTSRATVNRDEAAARRMLKWAAHPDRKLCERTVLDGREQLREAKRDAAPLIPSPREVALVVAALEQRSEELARSADGMERCEAPAYHGAALTVATALVTGLRLDELRHIKPENLHDGSVHVVPEEGSAAQAWMTKGFRARAVPIGAEQLEVVRQFLEWRSGKGARGKPVGLAGKWIAKKIDEGLELAKVQDWSFRMHDLRRTFCTENRRAGIAITVLRDWMGHRDTGTTERYLGRYRDDASLKAATSPALAIFNRKPADVVNLKDRRPN